MVYNTVVLGGLLHDVDKFLHLDSVELIKSFVHELDKICNVELLETLVIGELQPLDPPIMENIRVSQALL